MCSGEIPLGKADEFEGEIIEFRLELLQLTLEEVVGHECRDGRHQTDGRGHQRLGDARSHRGEVRIARGPDAPEGVDDAPDGAEEADEGTHRGHRRQSAQGPLEAAHLHHAGPLQAALHGFHAAQLGTPILPDPAELVGHFAIARCEKTHEGAHCEFLLLLFQFSPVCGALEGRPKLLGDAAAPAIEQGLANDHHPAEQRESKKDHQHRLGNRTRVEHDLQKVDLVARGCCQDRHAISFL